jgi:uncharacterized membrane protein
MNDYYSQTDIVKEVGGNITLALYILYGISIGAAMSGFIGIILLCCRSYSGRIFVHIGWCVSCAIMILFFALISILHPANGILMESCDYTE